MRIFELPPLLFLHIREFICPYAEYTVSSDDTIELQALLAPTTSRRRIKGSSYAPAAWRNFVNANKKVFAEIKRLTVYYDLKEDISRRLIWLEASKVFGTLTTSSAKKDEVEAEDLQRLPVAIMNRQIDFMIIVDIAVLNPLLTIGIELPQSYQSPLVFDNFTLLVRDTRGPVRYGEISLKAFPFIKNLIIWADSISQLPLDYKLKIEIDPSMRLNSFVSSIPCEFFDQTEPQAFQHLTFARVRLISPYPDVGVFQSVKNLDLSRSAELKDVSCLQYVHSLNLSRCQNVEDVSMLGRLYRLNISYCLRILSISNLGNVRYLDIRGLSNLQDGLPADSEVKELTLDARTYDRSGISSFKDRNKKIALQTPSPSMFQQNPELASYFSIHFSKVWINFRDLRTNYDLSLIKELALLNCSLPTVFCPTVFPDLRKLILKCQSKGNEGIQEFICSNFPSLQILKIVGSSGLKNLVIDHDMKLFELDGSSVVNLTIQGSIERLKIGTNNDLKVVTIKGTIGDYEFDGKLKFRMYIHK